MIDNLGHGACRPTVPLAPDCSPHIGSGVDRAPSGPSFHPWAGPDGADFSISAVSIEKNGASGHNGRRNTMAHLHRPPSAPNCGHKQLPPPAAADVQGLQNVLGGLGERG